MPPDSKLALKSATAGGKSNVEKVDSTLNEYPKDGSWDASFGARPGLSFPTQAEDTKTAEASADVVQNVGHNQVNWTSKVVWAVGSGAANLKDGNVAVARLNAERAAKLDALRNLLETIKGIQIDGRKNAGDLMSNGKIQSKVQGIAHGFKSWIPSTTQMVQ